MRDFAAQIILAARGDDVEGWINTLVVVLLVVFWAVGGILKARAKKTEAEDEEEGYGKKPFKPGARPATAKPMYKAQRAQVRRPQPQRIRADMKIEPRRAKPSITGRKVQEPKAAAAKMAVAEPEKPVSALEELIIEPLLSAEEPDELRKAILHYEILGKPLSLREPVDDRLC
jgi:hypothetical protein